MELILYRTLDDNNVINKTLTNAMTVNINFKRDTNIVNPDIVLKGDFRGFNYAHIPDLNRYYFIESIEQLNLHLVKLNMKCDVLETYKGAILNTNCEYQAVAVDGDNSVIVPDSVAVDKNIYYSDVTLKKGSSITLTTIEVIE